jgi:hypothetical protein
MPQHAASTRSRVPKNAPLAMTSRVPFLSRHSVVFAQGCASEQFVSGAHATGQCVAAVMGVCIAGVLSLMPPPPDS